MWWLLVPCLHAVLALVAICVYDLLRRTRGNVAQHLVADRPGYATMAAWHRKERDSSWAVHGMGNAILVKIKLQTAIEFIDRLGCVDTGQVSLREADGLVVYDLIFPGPCQVELIVDVRNNVYQVGKPRGPRPSSYTHPPVARLLATTLATWGEDYDEALDTASTSRGQFRWVFERDASKALRLLEQIMNDMSPVS